MFEPRIPDSPLAYTSPNVPRKRDVPGTRMLAFLVSAKRYVHVTALRNDGINPALLDMQRVCSDDPLRRRGVRMNTALAPEAFSGGDGETG